MKVTCLSIVSKEYDNIYKVHRESLDKYLPDYNKVIYRPDSFKSIYEDMGQHICSIRPKVILEEFKKNDPDWIIFMGADVVFYKDPTHFDGLLHLVCPFDVIATPHILTPLPDDGLFPNNAGISKTGHINSDFVAWRNTPEVINFLQWQAKQLEDKCITTDGIFLDQTWLSFLPIFLHKVEILKDPSYNIAYWNLHERDIDNITFFQFSGFDPQNISNISKHQNRYGATMNGKLAQILVDYAKGISK